MLPAAIIFVEVPQYGLDFLETTLPSLDCKKILVVDSEMLERGRVSKEQLTNYDVVYPAVLQSESAILAIQQTIATAYRVLAVLGFSEISVLPAAILAEAFDVPGIGTQVARACRNKFRMAEQLSRHGVPGPRYFLAERGENFDERVASIGGYPVICKPLMGFASFGVIKASSEPELNQAVRKIARSNRFLMGRYYGLDESCSTSQVLVQSFIPGIEVAIDGYVQEGKSHILIIIDKPDVSQGPYFADAMHIAPTRLEAAIVRQIEQQVQASVTALGLDNSPFHLEARLSDENFHLLELAARVSFVRLLRNAQGIDALAIMIALRLGNTPDAKPQWHRHAGTYCITPHEPGIFAYLEGREEMLQDSRVAEIPVLVEPGQRVAPAPASTGDLGHVVACADSYDEVLEVLTEAKKRLKVVVT